eukprot:COSAG01_NODE_3090_length_6601_cov_5.372347_4_plen_168_part_00
MRRRQKMFLHTWLRPFPAVWGQRIGYCNGSALWPARVMRGRVMITDHCRRQVRLIRRSSYYNDVCMTWIQCSARTHSVLQRHESLSASYVEALCPSTNRRETYRVTNILLIRICAGCSPGHGVLGRPRELRRWRRDPRRRAGHDAGHRDGRLPGRCAAHAPHHGGAA